MLRQTASILATLLLALYASATIAQPAYPAKTVRIIVPYPAGGTSDILARSISEKLAAALATTVIVENKPGANGTWAPSSSRGRRRMEAPCCSPTSARSRSAPAST